MGRRRVGVLHLGHGVAEGWQDEPVASDRCAMTVNGVCPDDVRCVAESARGCVDLGLVRS